MPTLKASQTVSSSVVPSSGIEQQIKELDKLLLTWEKKGALRKFFQTNSHKFAEACESLDKQVMGTKNYDFLKVVKKAGWQVITNTKDPNANWLKTILKKLPRSTADNIVMGITKNMHLVHLGNPQALSDQLDFSIMHIQNDLEESANKYVVEQKARLLKTVAIKSAIKPTSDVVGKARTKFKPQVIAIEGAGAAAESTESQVIKQGKEAATKATGEAAGKTFAKTIFKRGLAILGPVTTAWGIYDILSGKDFPVHSGGIYKAEAELTSTQYSEKEHDDALELYNRLNRGTGNIKEFKSYPAFFVYIKFAKDERIQNMPPHKVKAMINIAIDCINRKYFTASKFTVDDTIKAFNDLEKMNGLFRK